MKFLLRKSQVNLINKLDNFFIRISDQEKHGWRVDIKFALIAFFISIFFAFPSLWLYFQPDRAGRLLSQMMQAENPLNRDLPPIAQLLGYRFLVPSLNYFLGLRGFFVVVIPILSSFVNLFLLSRIIRTRTNNNSFTLVNLIGLSLTWFIAEGTAFWGTTDSVSHLLILIPAAYKVNPLYFIFAIPSSLFNDERSIFASAFLLLFILRRDLTIKNNLKDYGSNISNLKITRNFLFTIFSIFIGFIFWLLGRYIIYSGILAPTPDISLVTNQITNFWQFIGKYWPPQILNYLSSFKWVYFFPLFLIIELIKKSSNNFRKTYGFNYKYYFGIHFLVFLFYSSIVMINGDVWRSMSYTYFFILESILILYTLNKELTWVLNYWITFLMLLTPVSFFGKLLTPQISFPLPVVLLRTYSGFGEKYMIFLKKLFIFLPS